MMNKYLAKVFGVSLLLICNIQFKQTAMCQSLPSLPSQLSMQSTSFDSLCRKIDTLWRPILDNPSFDEENYEDSYMEYSRWRKFWKKRIGGLDPNRPGHLTSINSLYNSSQINRSTNCSTGNLNSNWKTMGPNVDPIRTISNGGVSQTGKAQSLGFVQSVAVNPTNQQILFAGSETAGIFKSTDGGLNWRNKSDALGIPGLGIMDIQFDPFNIHHIIAATGGRHSYGAGIINSLTSGDSWTLSLINTLPITSEIPVFRQVRFDPDVQNKIWAISDNLNLFISTNGGLTFNDVSTIPGNNFNQHKDKEIKKKEKRKKKSI